MVEKTLNGLNLKEYVKKHSQSKYYRLKAIKEYCDNEMKKIFYKHTNK